MDGLKKSSVSYTEKDVQSLDWREHIRFRPGMYIGKLGDGTNHDDGIYVLIKEILDNSVDEFLMGAGHEIKLNISEKKVTIRDYGRGIPLGKLEECVSKINTGAKYDSKAFQKSVGLNGVGSKAVNALSEFFKVTSIRDGKQKSVEFSRGEIVDITKEKKTRVSKGTLVEFIPDSKIFGEYSFTPDYIEERLWNYAYLNANLVIQFEDKEFNSQNGLRDLLSNKIHETPYYPIIHFRQKDLEFAFSHVRAFNETQYSFVNGQYTVDGGTHLSAFREGVAKAVKDFYKKDLDPADVRSGIVGAVSIRICDPVFESQTKTKLGSVSVSSEGPTIRSWVVESVRKNLSDYLHKNPETANVLLHKIQSNERDRKEMAGIRKLAKEREKKFSIHNKKLRNCKIHFNSKHPKRLESQIFITEGESASGSITKSRNVNTQAVFSLKGKPLNTHSKTRKIIFENEEMCLLQNALNLQDGVENLRFNKVIIATDADVDGMHIRLLLLTFFLQFFPELVRAGHVYILQTPLFRVRDKKKVVYCYSEKERDKAVRKLGKGCEVTRFKGLGEISPSEFSLFIGSKMILDRVYMKSDSSIAEILEKYMGKNTPERRSFIMENLRIENEVSN